MACVLVLNIPAIFVFAHAARNIEADLARAQQ